MSNMVALNTVYNHYMNTYPGSVTSGRYDSHKKAELKDIYARIVKLNKESPLFLPVTGTETRAFAIGVKEGARSLSNLISSMGGIDSQDLLNKKVAYSGDESVISTHYIGNSALGEEVLAYDIEVRSLATPQTNLGAFLPEGRPELPSGTYSFDVNIQNTNYEFQYNITDEDSNRSLQEKLARLINRADIGIEADVVEDGGYTSLRLISESTGTPIGREDAFTVSDDDTSRLSGSVAYFGIGDIARPAMDAQLVINGQEKSVSSNHFTLEHTYDIQLKGISQEGESTRIGVMDDTASLKENIGRLVEGYNGFVGAATMGEGSYRIRGNHLLDEMKRIAGAYSDSLKAMGYEMTEEGKLSIHNPDDPDSEGELNILNPLDAATSMRAFADSLLRKSKAVSIDPMQYIDKTMVAYKNPKGRNYPTPYITSAYSGMLFNSYC